MPRAVGARETAHGCAACFTGSAHTRHDANAFVVRWTSCGAGIEEEGAGAADDEGRLAAIECAAGTQIYV